MAYYYEEPSHTFNEYLLIPRYTGVEHSPQNIDLHTPLTRFSVDEKPQYTLNIPLVSAIMQSVSNDGMAISLAKEGGLSFIFCSQSIEKQAAMVCAVKNYKAGFVESDSNLKPENTLEDVLRLKEKTGHTTVAVTDDGTAHGKLLGVITGRDYRPSRMARDLTVAQFMTPIEKIHYADEGVTLKEANDIIWEYKLNSLPVLDTEGKLYHLCFVKIMKAKKSIRMNYSTKRNDTWWEQGSIRVIMNSAFPH